MKKILLSSLAFMLAISMLAGCDTQTNDPAESTAKETDEVTEPSTETEEQVEANPVSDFKYKKFETGVLIEKYLGESTHVVIPRTIENLPVTGIGLNCFSASDVVSVDIPDTVKGIGEGAFRNCTMLEEIDLSSDSLTGIMSFAFQGCTSLRKVQLGDNITEIGERAFHQCSSLKEVILPKNLTKTGVRSFSKCDQLEKIVIPRTLTKWGLYDFADDSALKTVVFEDGLNYVPCSFVNCMSLEEITIPASVTKMDDNPFWGCSALVTVRFLGNAPEVSMEFPPFDQNENLTIYYDPTTEGWDTTPLRDLYTLVPMTESANK